MMVVIAGTSTFLDSWYVDDVIEEAQENLGPITEVLCGGAPGVDTLGRQWAEAHKIPVRLFEPAWGRFGRAAGPIRNREMAEAADYGILVWDGQSRGTADMIRCLKRMGKPMYVASTDGERIL